jgi:hypothetical protein
VATRATSDPKLAVNQAHAEILALKAARYLAYEKLLEIISGVHLDSTTLLQKELIKDTRLKGRVEGLVREARTVSERVDTRADGAALAEVRLGVLLDGPQGLKAAAWQAYQEGRGLEPRLTPTNQPPKAHAKKNEKPTGLIILAQGLGAKPAMFPRLVAEPDGAEIFGAGRVDPQAAMEKGVVGYAPDLAKAKANPRVGANPLVIRAQGTREPGSADLVVSAADAARISSAEATSDILTKCNVVIVIE